MRIVWNIDPLHGNQSTYIPIGTPHRLENPGKIDLELIEVQSGGSYPGEDDIVQFEDDYRRKWIAACCRNRDGGGAVSSGMMPAQQAARAHWTAAPRRHRWSRDLRTGGGKVRRLAGFNGKVVGCPSSTASR
jgi:hypothetical protein